MNITTLKSYNRNVCVLQDRRADPENHPCQVQGVHRPHHRTQTQHHHRQRPHPGECRDGALFIITHSFSLVRDV